MSGIFGIFEISGSGLSAQRKKLNAVAKNIANIETTRTPEGGPYRRKQVVFSEDAQSGTFAHSLKCATTEMQQTDRRHMASSGRTSIVRNEIAGVSSEELEAGPDCFKLLYDPTHPDADEDGYVAMPDINVITEMVEMMGATRAYEANISVTRAAKSMFQEALNI